MTENVNALWSLFSSEFPGKPIREYQQMLKGSYWMFEEEWKNDQEFVQYMSELNSYSIEKLREFCESLDKNKPEHGFT